MESAGFISGLMDFLHRGPVAALARARVEEILEKAGIPASEGYRGEGPFRVSPGGSSLLAVRPGTGKPDRDGMILAVAHLDAPCLKLKQVPEAPGSPGRFLVETYGSPVRESFLNIPLRLAGTLYVRDTDRVRVEEFLSCSTGVIPALAPHLKNGNQDISVQTGLPVLWSLEGDTLGDLLFRETGIPGEALLSTDLFVVPAWEPRLIGTGETMVLAYGLDDRAMVYAALQAFLAADPSPHWQAIWFVDHEEIGSMSASGGFSSRTAQVLERVALGAGLDREGYLRMLEASRVLSLDMAHGYHPGYPEAYDEPNAPRLGAGPVFKSSAAGRYAISPGGQAWCRLVAGRAGTGLQTYQNRSDLRGGTTLGPMVAALTGIETLDLGAPMLSMHMAGELCATEDLVETARLLEALLTDR